MGFTATKTVKITAAATLAMATLFATAATAQAMDTTEHTPDGQVVTVYGPSEVQAAYDAQTSKDKNTPHSAYSDSGPELAAAAASANVCGSGYTISTGAARYGTYGTTYTWTNGTSTGSRIYDKPICAVFFNDTGYTRYMGVRLKDNYTSTPDTEDFGAYRSYAGPVYQKKGYCGRVYSYMEIGGKAVVDNYLGVGSCN